MLNIMKASEIIKQKLRKAGNEVSIRQLNGNITNFYFITDNTFWSDGLHKLLGNGYGFEMFDILEKESFRFKNRSIPKGNARIHKLGEPKCDMNTAIGILGYKYYQKRTGESIFEPMHVIAAVLDWADIAKNERGYITFN